MRSETCKSSVAAYRLGKCDIVIEGDIHAEFKFSDGGWLKGVWVTPTPSGGFASAGESKAAVDCMMNSIRDRGSVEIGGIDYQIDSAKNRPSGTRLDLVVKWRETANGAALDDPIRFEVVAGLRRADCKAQPIAERRHDPMMQLALILWAFRDASDAHQTDPDWAAKRGPATSS